MIDPFLIKIGQSRFVSGIHDPFWSFWVQIGQSQSVLVISGPNWPIRVRFGHFGSELANHGPVWSFLVQIGQSRSVFQIDKNKPANNSLDYKSSLQSSFFVFFFLVSSISSVDRTKIHKLTID